MRLIANWHGTTAGKPARCRALRWTRPLAEAQTCGTPLAVAWRGETAARLWRTELQDDFGKIRAVAEAIGGGDDGAFHQAILSRPYEV